MLQTTESVITLLQNVKHSLYYTPANDCMTGFTLRSTDPEIDCKSVTGLHFLKTDCCLGAGDCQHSDVQTAVGGSC